MQNKTMINLYLYSRYERFWHWLQAALVIILLATGFEIKGLFTLFGFQKAVEIHNFTGLLWLAAFTFFVFWVFTTGEWRQYIPTIRKLFSVVRYYALGIFRGEDHPVFKRKEAKHNPLQRLIYLGMAALLLPVQMLTGFLCWGYNSWGEWGMAGFLSLKVVSVCHVAGAFGILAFLIAHLYMITTGHSLFGHTKAMITGWETVEEGAEIEDWEKARVVNYEL